MMDYQMFKEIVKENIKDYMSPEYRDATVEVISVNKVNGVRDALAIRKPDEQIAPNLYLDDFYEAYQQCDNLEMTLKFMAEEYGRMADRSVKKLEIDMSQMKDRVVMMLVNTEQNKEMLADLPHREFQDLSVIYRYVVSQDEHGMASIKVTNEMLVQSGMTPEELFQHAAENSKKMFPSRVCRLEDVLFGMPGGDGIPEELAGLFETDRDPKESLWVITNSSGVNGAVSMLYDENLNKLAEKMGTDLYIMPSSVHEVLAVSVEMGSGNPEELAEMVQGANMSVVELEDRLSNNVYHYDKDLRELKLATQIPNQRLDGVVAEPELIYGTEPKR
ncbi:MAG: hypothetical protein K2J67_03450 [Lachnospiraceae bacterium]|nr:hypothetical protein [Lachnospiraceae bacterium]